MIKKYLNIVIISGILAVIYFVFRAGYNYYPKKNPCPVAEAATLIIRDTTKHYIPWLIPSPPIKPDTVYRIDTVPRNIDTAMILQRYYSKYSYTRHFGDSLISADLKDVITQNMPVEGKFTYKLLRPRETINNLVTNINWNRYIYAGINLNTYDPKLTGAELLYAGPKLYLGAGYMPFIKGINIKVGGMIFKFKKTN